MLLRSPTAKEEDMRLRWMMLMVLTAAVLTLRATAFTEPMPSGVSEEAVKSAKTPEQHQAIADAYAKEAANLRAMADSHRHMDSWYGEPGYKSSKLGFPRHCRALAQDLDAAAKEMDGLAKAHREMAYAAAKHSK
jgi:hypothetical protein